MSAGPAFAIVHERPRTGTLAIETPATVHLPATVPVVTPPVPAKDLFVLTERLDRGIGQVASVRGLGNGTTAAGAVCDTMKYWGWGYVAAATTALVQYVGVRGDPSGLILAGAIAAGVSLIPIYGVTAWIDSKLRRIPAPVKLAEPFLAAFKSGANASQAMVTRRAQYWADRLHTLQVTGQDLRQQLRELANVRVDTDRATTVRLDAIEGIVQYLPNTKNDPVHGDLIAGRLESLDGEDRAQVAALLLERLYDGEKLIGTQYTAADSERLYAALIKTQPTRITNSDDLQKLVAPRP